MRIPEEIRKSLREQLWSLADALDWAKLDWYEKSAQYEAWTRDPTVGGLLSNYMDQRRIRVYVKDTIMKGYIRSRQASPQVPLLSLGIDENIPVAEAHERPHGRTLADGRMIAWGSAEEWKLVLTAVYERSYGKIGARPYAAVLLAASVGKFHQVSVRAMVQDVANRLGIERLVWLE